MLIPFLLVISSAYAAVGAERLKLKFAFDIPLDENNRATSHYLLYHGSPACQETFESASFDLRESFEMSDDLARQFFKNNSATECSAVCIEKGTPYSTLLQPMPDKMSNQVLSENPLQWVNNNCQRAEVAFINYADNDAKIFWINEEGKRVQAGYLKKGERNTVWLQSFLGHQFEVVDTRTYKILGRITVEETGFHTIGGMFPSKITPMEVDDQVMNTFSEEWVRKNNVKRTFTPFGFEKGRLPDDVFGSMSAFYYNNRDRAFREEWNSKGLFVNWWEQDVYFAPIPLELKKKWQLRLKAIVEAWVGVELEMTDIYGMRRYEEGARLLTHVDRQSTHACSLIINVAQGEMREPWKVEIYDFADRLHEVEMDPGDIVYYESARCLHGRMQPLQGSFYVNLFAHYRPKLPSGEGDPDWFKKPNPPEAPTQVLDIGTCSAVSQQVAGNGSRVECKGGEFETPETLSPFLETLKGPQDLFRFWKQTGVKEINVQGNYEL